MYQNDKFYSSTKSKEFENILGDTCTVILYTQIGTNEFKTFHERLVDIYGKMDINYVLRHNYPLIVESEESESQKIGLSGFGVELDIKRTEYKATDDTKVNAAKDSAAQEAETSSDKQTPQKDQPIQGFYIETLKNHNPSLNSQLDEFRKFLIESQLELAPLKAWQMQDLSLQAAQNIVDAPNGNEALRIFEDLSQNFPIRALPLSKVSVRSDLRKTLKSNQQVCFSFSSKLKN